MNSPGRMPQALSRAEALALATDAAASWGVLAAPPELINIRENAVFRVTFTDGRLAALRLHRPGYQSRAGIEAELEWTTRLAAHGVAVPEPLATAQGPMTETCGNHVVSVVSWLEGQPMGAAMQALTGDLEHRIRQFHALGAFAGDLHRVTDLMHFDPPLIRPKWDAEGLLGPDPFWGRFWNNPAFDADSLGIIKAARSEAREVLARGRFDYGLIHADLMRENILISDDRISLIDFDDSGYGYRLYDLGTALVQNLEEPELPAIAAALAAGYRQTRPASDPKLQDLVLFTLLRCLASAGWIMSRAAPDDPRQRLYADRALRLSRHFLEGSAPW
jgi:Ser/Thr protein kinase RdoA (MazF antagonist)